MLIPLLFNFISLLVIPVTGIQFSDIDIEQALRIAQEEDKMVFIDTYASWCAPCKKLEPVFADPRVAQFFNNEFVNLKIDMESPIGKKLQYTYEVVWLPTLIIIDKDGEIVSKVARLVDAEELLEIGQNAISGYNQVEYSLERTPFSQPGQQAQTDYNPESKEQIIYVYDERASSGRPHIMYHEAYLHLQLMDGKHNRVVNKYLSTQDDWSKPKNLKLIFDFLDISERKRFDYFIHNKHLFYDEIGKKKVDQSLDILIYESLHNGFPRPSLEEAITLYAYIDPDHAEQKAYKYYLNRLFIDQAFEDFDQIAKVYLNDLNPYDFEIYGMYIERRLLEDLSDVEIQKFQEVLRMGIQILPENLRLPELLSQLGDQK